MRNQLVSIRKQSMATYFSQNCQKRDKTFWNTVSPFITDKKFRNCNNIILVGDTSKPDSEINKQTRL